MRNLFIFLFLFSLSLSGHASIISVFQDKLKLETYAHIETAPETPQILSSFYSGSILGNSVEISSIDSHLTVEALEGETYSVQANASAENSGSYMELVADTEVYLTGPESEGTIYNVIELAARAKLDWVFAVADGDTEFSLYMLETAEGYFSLFDVTLNSLVLEIFGSEFGLDYTLQDGHQYALYAEALDTNFDDGNFEIYMNFEGAEFVSVPEPATMLLLLGGLLGLVVLRRAAPVR